MNRQNEAVCRFVLASRAYYLTVSPASCFVHSINLPFQLLHAMRTVRTDARCSRSRFQVLKHSTRQHFGEHLLRQLLGLGLPAPARFRSLRAAAPRAHVRLIERIFLKFDHIFGVHHSRLLTGHFAWSAPQLSALYIIIRATASRATHNNRRTVTSDDVSLTPRNAA